MDNWKYVLGKWWESSTSCQIQCYEIKYSFETFSYSFGLHEFRDLPNKYFSFVILREKSLTINLIMVICSIWGEDTQSIRDSRLLSLPWICQVKVKIGWKHFPYYFIVFFRFWGGRKWMELPGVANMFLDCDWCVSSIINDKNLRFTVFW